MHFVEHVFENITTIAGIAFVAMSAPTVIPVLIKHRHRLKRHWPWLALATAFLAMSFAIRIAT